VPIQRHISRQLTRCYDTSHQDAGELTLRALEANVDNLNPREAERNEFLSSMRSSLLTCERSPKDLEFLVIRYTDHSCRPTTGWVTQRISRKGTPPLLGIPGK